MEQDGDDIDGHDDDNDFLCLKIVNCRPAALPPVTIYRQCFNGLPLPHFFFDNFWY